MSLNNTPVISVSLLRVSNGHVEIEGPNKKAIDLIVDCPTGYKFTSCILEARESENSKQVYNLDDALFGDAKLDTHWNIVIPLAFLGIDGNAIYRITLKARPLIEENGEYIDEIDEDGDSITTTMLTSDVTGSFNCLMSSILTGDPCKLSDEVIRNYLILYAHQVALQDGNEDLAWEYFKMLDNCFNRCGKDHSHVSSCNCGR